MPQPSTKSTRLACIQLCVGLGLSWFLLSCAGDRPSTRIIIDQPDRTIGLEVTYREGAHEYTHPANIPPATLLQAFRYIQVIPASLLSRLTGGSSIHEPAFTEEQTAWLAEKISSALAQATALETATFFWSSPRENGIWEITSGGAYIHHEALHLHLANYRHAVSGKTLDPQLKYHPLTPWDEPIHRLEATPPLRDHSSEFSTILRLASSWHFQLPLAKTKPNTTTHTSKSNEEQTNADNSSESIRQRLQLLQELQQNGLITEEEYQRKRKEILNGL